MRIESFEAFHTFRDAYSKTGDDTDGVSKFRLIEENP